MIIKLAGLSSLPFVSTALETGLVGSNIHDLTHFITSKSNRFGKWVQSTALADSIIAAKKATEGKMFANRKWGGALVYSRSPQKALALHELNQITAHLPARKMLLKFNNNKLDIDHLRKVLGRASKFSNALVGVQAVAPLAGATISYNKAKEHGYDNPHALRQALKGAAVGGLVSVSLYAPRKIFGGAASLHEHLSKDNGYGYGILESAAKKAEKSMNRKHFNYGNWAYKTPEENLKADLPGKVGEGFKKLLGQKTVKGYSKAGGWTYGDEQPSLIQRVQKRVDSIPHMMGIRIK